MRLFAEILKISISTSDKKKKSDRAAKTHITQDWFLQNWPYIEEYLSGKNEEKIAGQKKEIFVKIIQKQSDSGLSYLDAIQTLKPAQAQEGSNWLSDIVVEITKECLKINRAPRRQEK
jgi:hypothetical protein